MQAKDSDHDGFGAADTDGDLRDSYDVKTTVALQSSSQAGRESAKPVTVAGTVDWEGGSADDARVTVIACAIDRPDRALIAGSCAPGEKSRQPVSITLTAEIGVTMRTRTWRRRLFECGVIYAILRTMSGP